MNELKKTYVESGIVFEDYRTRGFTGSPEMIEEMKAAAMNPLEKQKCSYEDIWNFPTLFGVVTDA